MITNLFSPYQLFCRILRKYGRSFLDLGCGKAGSKVLRYLMPHEAYCVGADVHLPSLTALRERKTHDDCVLADVRHPPFRERSFDVVLLMEVLEHLQKPEGLQVLASAEKISRNVVVLSTPVGFLPQTARGENTFQVHMSGWLPREFRERGYRVYGATGFRFLFGEEGRCQAPFVPIKVLFEKARLLTMPFIFFTPNTAFDMLCLGKVEEIKSAMGASYQRTMLTREEVRGCLG